MSTLVIAEHDNLNLKPATLNTVAAAKELNGEIHLLIAGNSCQSVADEAIGVEGVSKILMSDNAAYENHLAESTANIIKLGKQIVSIEGRLYSSSGKIAATGLHTALLVKTTDIDNN